MTRNYLRNLIERAHSLMHAGKLEEAHEVLHQAVGGTGSLTQDPEVQEAARRFLEAADGKMPCGHVYGDLIWSPGTVTKCGACLADRQKKETVPARDSVKWQRILEAGKQLPGNPWDHLGECFRVDDVHFFAKQSLFRDNTPGAFWELTTPDGTCLGVTFNTCRQDGTPIE